MRLFLFPLISYFIVRVWASGYQGYVERVLLYNAYQIDEYNDPDDRKIGFNCRQWDDTAGTCRNNQWDECRSRTGGRCNFDDLCFFLGKAPRNNGWQALIPGTDRLDVRVSAQNCMNLHYPINSASPIRRIYNFPPHSAMKGGGTKWNEFVVDLSVHIDDTYRRMHKPLTDEENAKFSNFDYAADRARIGDHGPYLVRIAQARLTVPVVTRNMGANPAAAFPRSPQAGTVWQTVDWAATITQFPANTEAGALARRNARAEISAFWQWLYRGTDRVNKNAREHFQVNESYRQSHRSSLRCRGS